MHFWIKLDDYDITVLNAKIVNCGYYKRHFTVLVKKLPTPSASACEKRSGPVRVLSRYDQVDLAMYGPGMIGYLRMCDDQQKHANAHACVQKSKEIFFSVIFKMLDFRYTISCFRNEIKIPTNSLAHLNNI